MTWCLQRNPVGETGSPACHCISERSVAMSLSHMLLSGIFIGGGADAFFKPGYRVNKVENAGIPEPQQAVVLNSAAMMIGGTALALDIAPKAAAALLIGTLEIGRAACRERG